MLFYPSVILNYVNDKIGFSYHHLIENIINSYKIAYTYENYNIYINIINIHNFMRILVDEYTSKNNLYTKAVFKNPGKYYQNINEISYDKPFVLDKFSFIKTFDILIEKNIFTLNDLNNYLNIFENTHFLESYVDDFSICEYYLICTNNPTYKGYYHDITSQVIIDEYYILVYFISNELIKYFAKEKICRKKFLPKIIDKISLLTKKYDLKTLSY